MCSDCCLALGKFKEHFEAIHTEFRMDYDRGTTLYSEGGSAVSLRGVRIFGAEGKDIRDDGISFKIDWDYFMELLNIEDSDRLKKVNISVNHFYTNNNPQLV